MSFWVRREVTSPGHVGFGIDSRPQVPFFRGRHAACKEGGDYIVFFFPLEEAFFLLGECNYPRHPLCPPPPPGVFLASVPIHVIPSPPHLVVHPSIFLGLTSEQVSKVPRGALAIDKQLRKQLATGAKKKPERKKREVKSRDVSIWYHRTLGRVLEDPSPWGRMDGSWVCLLWYFVLA